MAEPRDDVDDCEEYDCGDDEPCGACLACREYAAHERAREAATRGGIAAWALTALALSDDEL